jgi:hypothetical protein
MKMPVLSVNDRQWMKCRLKRTAWITAVLFILNVATTIGFWAKDEVERSNTKATTARSPEIRLVSRNSSSTSRAEDRTVQSIAPTGWRRTNRGWEHVSSWGSSRTSITALMETQAAREPALARGLLANVSKLSPVTFAICQVGAIVAIILATQSVSRSPEKKRVVL